MLPNRSLASLTLSALGAILLSGAAAANANRPAALSAQDAGATSPATTLTTSIILSVTNRQALQNFVTSTVTPGNSNYHRFLTVAQFRARFAPSDTTIAGLESYLHSFGISVNKIYANHLDITVSGTVGAFNAAFGTQIHNYSRNGVRFHAPASNFRLPGTLANLVIAVPGLSNEAGRFHSMIARLGRGAYAQMAPRAVQWPKSGTASGVPQDYTVGDVANFYDVNPLYHLGITGKGQTVGVMTLANFNPSDAYAYWRDIGLRVPANRITTVMVDGGTPVAPGVGDDETSLDVEQSGGLAPAANIRVYVAPNTTQGFLDLFYTAASENVADTVSISWGEPEEFYFAALNNGVSYVGQLLAMNQALLEGAAQGQSYFAAAGDSGAYDVNRFAPIPQYSMQLSVDAPASDPAITAAGGTTIAATIPGIPQNNCPSITIPTEQVWGWDYINNDWASCLGLAPDALFAVGGGGGVSSFWSIPLYQMGRPGMQLTQPHQSLIYYPNYPSTSGAQLLIRLPANLAGRNVPDLSLNSDPETGYVLVDCTDFPEPTYTFCAATGYGGTSFAAPQLNGITTLVDQANGGRVGLLNPSIYLMDGDFVNTSRSPFHDITAGDNWFYYGVPGYDDGAGIGSIDAAKLAQAFRVLGTL